MKFFQLKKKFKSKNQYKKFDRINFTLEQSKKNYRKHFLHIRKPKSKKFEKLKNKLIKNKKCYRNLLIC